MSVQKPVKRTTSSQIAGHKNKQPIVALTSYHTHTAAIADPYVDFLLVGDSLGMVMNGFETTLPVTLEMMIAHGKAVFAGAKSALIVVDMPFGSYEESLQIAFRNAVRIIKETQCGAVKLEGGQHMAPTIKFLVERGVPVMAHVGLTPQAINTLGGFKTQGKSKDQWQPIIDDAKAVADAGAFAVVLEAMAEPLAATITKQITIPTIGIGASNECDGQILVMEDMLGLSPRVPKFVKEFGKVGEAIETAIKTYSQDVKSRQFPSQEHTFELNQK